ncbi:hypothetical protein PZN53_09950 [Staphylococcus pettenkoferi]|uniref:hypothetical protein n=1 Tax=Staphylococcus pettenkoferi TaxID=170573 RepID=UPI002480766D|nr:hypothetical protein [Staphylococcus pettenkoferi]MDH9616851.1 hypothetical protein [Staphylococcus pettenkoferi]
MENENKYITVEHFNDREKLIYKYVDDETDKLKEFYHKLDKKIDLDRQVGEQTVAELKKLNSNFDNYSERVVTLENKTDENTKDIEAIQENKSAKKGATNELAGLIITGIFGLLTAAIGAGYWIF